MFKHRFVLLSALITLLASCSKVPNYVIQPDDMAQLLADIHIGESVIELNRTDYREDSSKQVFLESVLQKHSVTKQDLDTSFIWYGNNISYYIEVYDKTIELLEHRLAETGNRIAAENISMAGDSVDVWNYSRLIEVTRNSPTNIISFTFYDDENAEPGDSYTWRSKITNPTANSHWAIAADYTDGSTEFYSAEFENDGWNELKFVSDSTKTAKAVYGYMLLEPRDISPIWADSIMLIRNRLSPQNYYQHFKQHRILQND